MNFIPYRDLTHRSECGDYERREVFHGAAKKPYFNVWHLPTGSHVAAGFSAKEVSDRCDEHKARQG